MAQVMVNFRQDKDVKAGMERICKELGFSPSTAYNIFAKAVIRENGIPFPLSYDPFYSESNLNALRESRAQIEEGKVVVKTMDELLEMEES